MKRIILLLTALCAVGATMAQGLVTADTNTGHVAYGNGEELEYTVRYGFITGGRGHFSVTDTTIDNRDVSHVVCRGVTTGVPDLFFKVRDSYESYIDKQTQMPIKAVRNISEGRYRYYDEILYDRDSAQVHTIKKGTEPVPDNILDIVSAFYHARNNTFTNNLVVGDTIMYEIYFAGEVFPLRIKYRGAEMLSTKFGKLRCHKFSPITEVGRSFKTEDDMQVWITSDDNRLPIKIKFDLVVGSFVCELTKYKGLRYNLGA